MVCPLSLSLCSVLLSAFCSCCCYYFFWSLVTGRAKLLAWANELRHRFQAPSRSWQFLALAGVHHERTGRNKLHRSKQIVQTYLKYYSNVKQWCGSLRVGFLHSLVCPPLFGTSVSWGYFFLRVLLHVMCLFVLHALHKYSIYTRIQYRHTNTVLQYIGNILFKTNKIKILDQNNAPPKTIIEKISAHV